MFPECGDINRLSIYINNNKSRGASKKGTGACLWNVGI